MINKKYGVVYTPSRLAEFVAELLKEEAKETNIQIKTVLDPACGECALIDACKKTLNNNTEYWGIDVDKDVIDKTESISIIYNDAILPRNVRQRTAAYWRKKLPKISAIIANPPWSSEKIYERDVLANAGFTFIAGQYDSYVLFLELAYGIVQDDGLFAFILPDSIFDAQNESLRRFLAEKTEIRVIARLGEKIFEEVNRAATVLICRKHIPSESFSTKCFRLSTTARKEFLSKQNTLIDLYRSNVHMVLQKRFTTNSFCNYDIDTRAYEESLIDKIQSKSMPWENIFTFGRGVEISKSGRICTCAVCGTAQGYKKSQFRDGKKFCASCGTEILINNKSVENVILKSSKPGYLPIFVGENIHRYTITGESYIRHNVEGINYKSSELYSPPKLLIRKTGLGIYAAVDYSSQLTNQTVYILKLRDTCHKVPLEYYLAIINSRVVYYYYLKRYGENEWKSHPYLTKKIIFSLPVAEYKDTALDKEIIRLARKLAKTYSYKTDIELELLVMKKYGLNDSERKIISDEMNSLPDLTAVNDMKMEVKYV